jgi:hypothetical protein
MALNTSRKRGVILTPDGFEKLQTAKTDAEWTDNEGKRFTLEQLRDRTGLAVDTLMKVFARESKVDKQSLRCCFRAFKLILEEQDFFYPDEDNIKAIPPSEPQWTKDNIIRDTLTYIERPPIESICYDTLKQPGSLIRIKAPSLMGKTMLITRILGQLTLEGYRCIRLSFELADRQTHFNNLNKFLRWFCVNLTRELGLSNQLDDYWDEEGMGSKVSCTTYFADYLLTQEKTPLVICLDNVDLLFPHPEIYEDFFGLLRSWYEKARTRQRWQQLRLALVHATDVYIRLNINQSPFNVGLPLELSEFTQAQVAELAKEYKLNLTDAEIDKLMSMIGGHPYLLDQTFTYLKRHPESNLSQILQNAPTDAGIYANHLREFWLDLQNHPELINILKKIVTTVEAIHIEPMLAYQLHSMGLVNLYGNQVKPRCNLYRLYFCSHLEDM